MRTKLSLFLLLSLAFLNLAAAGQSQNDAGFAAQMEKAAKLAAERRWDDAVAEYRRADEMAGGKSYFAAIGLAQNLRMTKDYSEAETAALRAVDLAPSKPSEAYAYWIAAMSAMTQAAEDPNKYDDAEEDFRAVLALNPQSGILFTRYYLGRLLLAQKRDEEGVAELKTYLVEAQQDSTVPNKQGVIENCRRLIEDPSRGHESPWGFASAPASPERNTGVASDPSTVPASVPPEAGDHFTKGQQLARAGKYDDAIKEFKAASKAAHDGSYDVLMQLALTYQALKAHKNVIETCSRAATVAANDVERARAHSVTGLSLIELGETKAEKYKEAEREFRSALELAPDSEFAHFNLGMALLRQSRDPEGIAEMKLFMKQHPDSASVSRAQKIAEDPRRAREVFIPDFSITTMDGEYISSSELVGKVVVLDFWASWCGPCRSSLGDLRSFSKHFSGKPVVLISISADRDEDTWRSFVQKNDMTWPQYFDEGGKIAHLFSVNAFPSYFVVDSEGIFRMKTIGAGNFQVGAIQEEVKKWLKKMDEGSKKKESAAAK